MILDSNVVAQETGYNTFNKFLIFGGNAANVSKLKNWVLLDQFVKRIIIIKEKH